MDKLDAGELMARARARTGLDDFGDLPFEEALDMLILSLERDARLDATRRAGAAAMITGMLAKNLALVEDRKRFPGIADEVVAEPIFILGLPRTGSTNLHRLMAQCEGIRAPRRWEMSLPSPPPEAATYDTDPRIAQVHAAEVVGVSEELQRKHPVTADLPEQCQSLNDFMFMNWSLLAPFELPTYRAWLLTADHRPSYEAHKRTLQHLQHRQRVKQVLPQVRCRLLAGCAEQARLHRACAQAVHQHCLQRLPPRADFIEKQCGQFEPIGYHTL